MSPPPLTPPTPETRLPPRRPVPPRRRAQRRTAEGSGGVSAIALATMSDGGSGGEEAEREPWQGCSVALCAVSGVPAEFNQSLPKDCDASKRWKASGRG